MPTEVCVYSSFLINLQARRGRAMFKAMIFDNLPIILRSKQTDIINTLIKLFFFSIFF